MQKWLPDELTGVAAGCPAPGPRWESLPAAEGAEPAGGRTQDRFQKESRFADPGSLLNNLTQVERALLFELVEQDVAREYETREQALIAEQNQALTEAKEEYDRRLRAWSGEFGAEISTRIDTGLHEIAQASARLAVQVAGKITRTLVPIDEQILVRAIQTTLFKIPGGQALRVRLHPEDAAWLQEQPELLDQLHIAGVEPDRRVERGGCLLQSGVREWDATLTGQLESLGETVQEAILTATAATPVEQPEADDDTGLE